MRRSIYKHPLAELRAASERVDAELIRLLKKHAKGSSKDFYQMSMYFLGFLDEHLQDRRKKGAGKRLRSSLCLLLAREYGAGRAAFPAAISIELFHNFTLVHDDIIDRDLYRRGRKTVWNLWGIDHAINVGDSLLLFACRAVLRIPDLKRQHDITKTLLRAFSEVCEGQHRDSVLSRVPLGSKELSLNAYAEMAQKKTGALFGAAAEVAGMVAGRSARERKKLRTFGTTLGVAFQMADDVASVWGSPHMTGKDKCGDIRECKKSLPLILAYGEASTRVKKRIRELYNLPRPLSGREIAEIKGIFDMTDTHSRALSHISRYVQRTCRSAKALTLSQNTHTLLCDLVHGLVPTSP